MKLSTKVDIKLGSLGTLKKYTNERIEVQLLHTNIKEIKKSILMLINEVNTLKNIILHMPAQVLFIEDMATNKNKHDTLIKFIELCSEMQAETNIKFELLAHCGWISEYDISDESLQQYMKSILPILMEKDIVLLLENTIHVRTDKDYDRCVWLVKTIRNKHLRLCIDMAHVRAVGNRLGYKIDEEAGFNKLSNYYRYLLPTQVEQIHFSTSINGDGFLNLSKTHGVRHYDVNHAYKDFAVLQKLKIHNAYIVPEVAEIDHNYNKRKNEIKEILLLKQIEKLNRSK